MSSPRLGGILVALSVLCTALVSKAGDVVWTNLSDGDWSVAANWNPNQVPGASDNAYLTNSGSYTVTLSAVATVLNLQVGSSGGMQALRLTGGQLSASTISTVSQHGTVTLAGGTIKSGTLDLTSGTSIIINNGTLDGVSVNGALDVGNTINGAGLEVLDGLTLNGTMVVGNPTNGNWGRVNFNGTQTLSGNATVVFGNSANNWILPVNSSSLTLAPSVTVHGQAGYIGYNGNGSITNQGTISADVSGGVFYVNAQPFVNQGVLEARNGGQLNILQLAGNLGQVSLLDGSILTLNGTYTNNLALNLTDGAVLNLNGNWVNTGVIGSTNATVNLGGSFTIAGLGILNRAGGTVQVVGTLNNASATLTLNATSGSWVLNGGTVTGGNIVESGGAALIINGGTLDGVTFGGALDVGNTINGAGLEVLDGLTLNGTMVVGNPTNGYWGRVNFTGTQTLSGNATVVFGNSGNNWILPVNSSSLTLAPTVTVRGQAGYIGYNGNGSITNRGTISADVSGGVFYVNAQPFVNQGVLEARNGGQLNILQLAGNLGQVGLLDESTLTLNGTYTNNLVLNLTNGATLNLNGNWVNTGVIGSTNATVNLGGSLTIAALGVLNRAGGTVQIVGTLNNASATLTLNATSGSWVLNGGTVTGGNIVESGGAALIINGGTLDGVTFNGALDVGNTINGAGLTVLDGLTLNGTMLVGNPTNGYWGRVNFTGTQTLGGNSTVAFGNSGNNWIIPANNSSSLTLAPSVTVHGQAGYIGYNGNGSITNQGTISADVSGGVFYVNAQPFVNQGVLEARNGGQLNILQLAGNLGQVSLLDGSILTLNGTYTNNLALNLTDGAVLNLNGNWINTGVIDSTNATVNLGGSFTIAALGVLNRAGGTVQVVGTLNNASSTLTLNATSGSWVLSAGTIIGGNIVESGGAALIISGGTLDGVMFSGALDVGNTINGAGLAVLDGLTLNGTMLVGNPTNGYWGRVNFTGTQTLGGNSTVAFGNSGNNWIIPANNSSSLTLAPSVTVHGQAGYIGYNGNGSITNQGTISADVSGGVFYVNAQPFVNQGVLEARNGGQLNILQLAGNLGQVSLLDGSILTLNGTYTNNLALNLTDGAVLNLNGNWINTGVIDSTNATVNLGGSFTIAALGVLNRAGGTVQVVGTLNNASATLTLNATSGSWVLNGGTVTGGNIVESGGAALIINGGTLDGVMFSGALDVGNTINGAGLAVLDGLTLNGTMLVGNPTNGYWGRVNFTGTQTLGGNATVAFGNSGNNWIIPANNSSSLTLAPSVTVHGQAGYIGYNGNGSITNQGTISADVSGGVFYVNAQPFVNQGVLEARNGGQLNILQLAGNLGQVSLLDGSILTLNGTYTNNLALNLTDGAVLNLNGNWINTGVIDSTNATVNLGGSFTIAALGVLNRAGGTVQVVGTLNNASATLTLNAISGSWVLNGGTVTGGNIVESGGAALIINSGTLDGVTFSGPLDVGNTINGAGLAVLDGLTLNGTMLVGNPTNGYWGRVNFTGTQTLSGNATVVFGNSGNNWMLPVNSSSLTLAPAVTVRGQAGYIGYNGNGSITNQGTISADVSGGVFYVNAQPFVNQGVLEARNGGQLNILQLAGNLGQVSLLDGSTLTLNGTYTNNLVLNLTNGATLNLNGNWVNAGVIGSTNATVNLGGSFTIAGLGVLNRAGGTVQVVGTLNNGSATLTLNATSASWVLNGGTVTGGNIVESGGAALIINSGTLDGVTFSGPLDVGNTINGAGLAVLDGLTLNGTMVVGNPTNGYWGRVNFTGTQTLSGNATVVFGNSGNNWILPVNSSSLTLAPSVTVHGQAGYIGYNGNGSITNQGTISVDVSGGVFYINAQPFVNQGVLEANPGTVRVTGDLSLPDSSTLRVGIGGATPGTQFGQMIVVGSIQLNGVLDLDLNNGFVPNAGQTFQGVLNWTSYSGAFLQENGLDLGNGLYFQPNFSGSGLSLVTGTSYLPPLPPPTNLVNQVVALGGAATFALSPIGQEPFSYQWQLNGLNLLNQTNASLVLTGVQLADEGSYCVVVVDAANLTNTYCANLNVLAPPSITTPPLSQTISAGATVTLTVVAAGDSPLRYQWRLNAVNIPGATNQTYTITNIQPSDVGSYSVVAANTVGAVISPEALVNVLTPALPFADNFAAAGAIAGLSGVGSGNNADATRESGEPYHGDKFGSNSVWVRWTAPAAGVVTLDTRGSSFDTLLGVYTGPSISRLTEIAGDDDSGGFFTSKLKFNALAGTTYDIAVDGLAGATGDIVLSWNLDASLPPIPQINSQPQDQTVPLGWPAHFTVLAQGSTALTYQWQFNGLALDGATDSTLNLFNTGPANVGYYSVTVSSADGQSVQSQAAALELGSVTGAHSQGKLEDLLADAFGTPPSNRPLDFSAFPSVSVGSGGSQLINNFNSTSEHGEPIHAHTVGGSSRWYLLTTLNQGTMIIDTMGSGVATLLSVYIGSNILSLQVVAEDRNDAADGIHSQVRFQTVAGTHYLIAVDGVDGVQGDIHINWRLGTAPVAAVAGVNEQLQAGATLVLDAGITNANPAPSYQWLLNGRKIPGATNSVYALTNVQPTQQGIYSVVVSNFAGAATEVVATVSVQLQSTFQLVADQTLGSLNFRVLGNPTQAVVLELSTDLKTWTPVFTNLNPQVPLSFLDTNWAARAQGFYRFKSWP